MTGQNDMELKIKSDKGEKWQTDVYKIKISLFL